MDFGLARAVEEPPGDSENSPTQTISPTRAGVILSTAPYMSPEQARGKVVDKGAEIWAFGCVLYDMLTGQRAFTGETTTDILAAVVKSEPDLARVPAKVRRLLRCCLEKDPKRQLRDISDAGDFARRCFTVTRPLDRSRRAGHHCCCDFLGRLARHPSRGSSPHPLQRRSRLRYAARLST